MVRQGTKAQAKQRAPNKRRERIQEDVRSINRGRKGEMNKDGKWREEERQAQCKRKTKKGKHKCFTRRMVKKQKEK